MEVIRHYDEFVQRDLLPHGLVLQPFLLHDSAVLIQQNPPVAEFSE